VKQHDEKDFIPHPRSGPNYRQALDYALCVVVGDLVRQATSLTEAMGAIRQAVDRLIRESGRTASIQDDPVDVPHLALATLRLHSELIVAATRLQLTYRYLQRAQQILPREDGDRDTDPGNLLGPTEATFED